MKCKKCGRKMKHGKIRHAAFGVAQENDYYYCVCGYEEEVERRLK